MNKKSLSLVMIIPLAAVGAVATAPTASAADLGSRSFHRVSCHLDADALRRGDTIKVEFKLHANSDRGSWVVVIKKNGRVIEVDRKRTHRGHLKVVEYTRDGRGTDRFSATAYNRSTGKWCSDRDTVYRGARFSR